MGRAIDHGSHITPRGVGDDGLAQENTVVVEDDDRPRLMGAGEQQGGVIGSRTGVQCAGQRTFIINGRQGHDRRFPIHRHGKRG